MFPCFIFPSKGKLSFQSCQPDVVRSHRTFTTNVQSTACLQATPPHSPGTFPGSPPVFALQDQGSCGFVPLSSSAPLHPVNARLVSDPGSRSQAAHHLMVSATPTSFGDLVTLRLRSNREAGFVSNFPLSEPLIYVLHDIPSP